MQIRNVFIAYVMLSMSATSFSYGQEVTIEWKDFDGIDIPIPPSQHPRLYIGKKDIADLKSRMTDSELKPVWNDLVKMSQEPDADDRAKEGWRYHLTQRGTAVRCELNAMKYLTGGNKKTGRQAITDMLTKLKDSEWLHGQDMSRAVGRRMVSGAIVYDWCYPLLNEQEKQAFIKEFVRLAKQLECGYPPVRQGAIVGHSSEWMIFRDLLSTSIAIYDEFPEMYHLTAHRLFKEHIPARNWFYPGHAYHQGKGYFNVRHANELFAAWIFDRMGVKEVFHPAQQFVPYFLLYARRPDGQMLAGGDVNYSRKGIKSMALIGLLSGSYYKDAYLNHNYLLNPEIQSHNKLYEFLWKDTELGRRESDDLPLTRYFGSPFGWMIARTGWDANSVIAEMKVNEYHFGNHQHHDGGAFQIYYKGPLAIDAGIYNGVAEGIRGYGNSHNKNYFKRTIAHNSLLVYDPGEVFQSRDYGGAHKTDTVRNEGGQRLPGPSWTPPNTMKIMLEQDYKVGSALKHGFGPDPMEPDYSYLKGDITEAYSGKVSEVKRSFTFLNMKNDTIPAAFIVFDKVVSSDSSFKKYWLLHSIEEPRVEENEITIARTQNGDSGKLINTSLLPKPDNSIVRPIGGPGKEFWVFGKNEYTEPVRKDVANERGAWRVEISPKAEATTDYFLNVMQVMDNGIMGKLSVRQMEGDKVIGVKLQDRITFFSKDMSTLDRSFSFSIADNGTYKLLLTDLAPGTWQIKKNGKVFQSAIDVKGDDGTIYFEGDEGDYQLLR
ncbi:MAG: heparinase II/III family protein [Cytophagales bacterium]|nr:heparinase II/III family protein [Cytophagales bacterium]